MSRPGTSADGRDDLATDRDDAADERDETAVHRDDAADQRDARAARRDTTAHDDSDTLTGEIRRIGHQILDHLSRIENATVDPADWPDLTAAAFARLDDHTAEQRRLAGLDRAAVTALLDQLHRAFGNLRQDRHAAARDRRAAAHDRHGSAGDRRDSDQDRVGARRDRHQATIEREQLDPRALTSTESGHPAAPRPTSPPQQLHDRMVEAIATSQQRIIASQETIDRTRRSTRPPVGSPGPPPEPPD